MRQCGCSVDIRPVAARPSYRRTNNGGRSAPMRPVRFASQRGRRQTQRERLVRGMIAVTARVGYAGASIAQAIAHAGVSRPTFYEYFVDKEDGFLAALAHAQQQLLNHVRAAVSREPPEHAMAVTIRALIA